MPEDKSPQRPPAWRASLDFENAPAEHYQDFWNEPLFRLVNEPPRRVLDLGCAGGMFGMKLKEKFADAWVAGVEANRAAAACAATRLDRVITGRVEALDLAAEGFAPGELDLVVAADILEHLVNPWEVLVRLKPFLAPDAVVVASIPNVRNLELVSGLLLAGHWEYAEHGLLDVTHLRFFTFDAIRHMFEQTGYQVEGFAMTFSRALAATFHDNRGREKVTLKMGRLTLEDVTPRELGELCAEQFLLRVLPVGAPPPQRGGGEGRGQ
jgi:trans-aconitate methyltransferase